jgi:hypothetical protein
MGERIVSCVMYAIAVAILFLIVALFYSFKANAGITAGLCSKGSELLATLFATYGEEPFLDAYVGTPGQPTGAQGLITWNKKTGTWSLLVEGSMPGSLCIGTGGFLMGPTKRKAVEPEEQPS